MSSHNITTTTTTTNSSFLTYQDNGTLGMMIKYPFNWKRLMAADDKAIIFLPPSKQDRFPENMVVALLDINNSMQAGQLSDQAINNYGEHYVSLVLITFQSTLCNFWLAFRTF
jgi:hypothetical protein